ncbi:MAG TPA: helix-turn-helix domain-containing protein [Clostridiaceae bacterium]|nr:helix-turn-helix domain-containing protein [Clostridiaceae bacterium]
MKINEKIKQLRTSKGLTLEDLANKTGFTKGYLSKIERSSNMPPFATVQVIAEALDSDLIELLEARPDALVSKNIDILISNDTSKEEWEEHTEVYSFKPLVNVYRNKYMSPFLFRVKKGATDITSHDSEEFVYVLEGNIELNYEGKIYQLSPGDSFYLDARIKHNFVNHDEKPALLIAVHFNYRRF